MSTVSDAIARFVIERAGERCEFCHMHQSLQGATFHIEHIIPRSRGGSNEVDNLAHACPSCNLSKSDRTQSIDPNSGTNVVFFNPRQHSWSDHFEWREADMVGRTDIGRATVEALNLNQARRKAIRAMERTFGLFPPQSLD